jgi:hypothetical protein
MKKFTDYAPIGGVKKTKDGYLTAVARAMRTGVQDYLASELGLEGEGIVRVYRPASSVHDLASLQSMSHAPITIDHPAEFVNPLNVKGLQVGEVSTAAKIDDDGWVSLPLILKDQVAIDAVEGGKSQLSAGYIADMQPSPDGSEYDYIMGPPQYNHLAIVQNARAGEQARIGDSVKPWGAAPILTQQKEKVMTFKTVVVGDKAAQVAADDALIIEAYVSDAKKQIDDLKAEIATLKVECADANSKIKTPDQVQALVDAGVAELVATIEKAKSIIADADFAGKSAIDIKKEVIQKVLGDETFSSFTSDNEFNVAFKVIKAQDKSDPVKAALVDNAGKTQIKDNGQSAYEAKLANAWKGK